MTLHKAALAFSLFTAITLPSYALAADEPPVVTLLLKSLEQQTKVKPTYNNVETGDDGGITISGLTANVPVEGAGAGGLKVSLDSLKLQNVTDKGEGLWQIGEAHYANLKLDFSGPEGIAFSADVPEMTQEDWFLKDPGASPTPMQVYRQTMNIAKKTTSSKITVNAAGQTFTSDGYTITWDGDPVTGSGKSSFKLSNVVVPEAAIASIDPTGQLKALGYSSLTFDLGADGTTQIENDNLGFDFDAYYTGRDIGQIKVGATATDIPTALIAEMQKNDPNNRPDYEKLMPDIQKIMLNRVVFRFEDNSVTAKLLPLAAQMQGMDVQTMIANSGAMVQLGLAELKNPAFTEKTVAAVTAFLKDPKSITVMAKPAAPVAVKQLMEIDQANPGAAIDLLGISVTAND